MPTLYMDDADFDEEEAPQDAGQPQEGSRPVSADGGPASASIGPASGGGGPPAAGVGPASASIGPAEAGGAPASAGRGPASAGGGPGDQPAAGVGPAKAGGAPAKATRGPEGQENASEAVHLAKARQRLEAARAVAQATGVDGPDDQNNQDRNTEWPYGNSILTTKEVQMGLERIAKGLEVLKASDHMAKYVVIRRCSGLSAYEEGGQETIRGSNGEPIGGPGDHRELKW